ncbi:MAG: Nramp family divalent metal transporter [Acidobacteriota bacterium]
MAEIQSSSEKPPLKSPLPDKYLPGVPYRDLPEPVPLKKVVGTSVIILATALGSGELVLWPFITTQMGLVLLWGAAFGFTLQFFLNMEIERYTLATGESAVTGFTRLWKPWGIVFVAGGIIPNAWPGWSTGAAQITTFVMGGGNVVLISIVGLLIIGTVLTISPVVYQTVEKIQTLFVSLVLIFIVIAVFRATTASAWGELFTSLGEIDQIPDLPSSISIAALLGALAYAGAGGAANLVQSNYIRDKGLGMGVHLPRIVSPITGQEEAAPSLGYMFPETEENMRRWRGWWKLANREQFVTFYALGLLSLVALSVLTYSTVGTTPIAEQPNMDFIRAEGHALQDTVAPWFGMFFWIAGIFILFSTNLGILDYTSRLAADSLKVSFLRDSVFWSESKLYFVVIWSMIIAGSIILLSGINQPLVLLVIAASLSGVLMFLYSILLIQLNRRVLPHSIKLCGFRLVMMVISVLFFGFFSLLLLMEQVGNL